MIKGFNEPLPLWIDLLNNKAKSEALADHLKSIPSNKKALRWPSGTGGKNYVFDKYLTARFNTFCIQSGIEETTLVVNPNDLKGHFETYKILSENLKITVQEFDNENYLRSHIVKSVKTLSDLKLFTLNYNAFLEKVAIEYRTKFIQFKKLLKDNSIIDPVAFVCDIPNDLKSTIWFNTLKNESENAIVHIYGQPDNKNYLTETGLSASLDKLKTHNLFVTEKCGIHFGDNTEVLVNEELAFTDLHFYFEKEVDKILASKSFVKGVWKHFLFDILKPGVKLSPYRQLTIFPDLLIKDEYQK